MTKRILSITMCVMLLLSALSIAASAMGETYYMDGPDFVRVMRFPGDEVHVRETNGKTLTPRYSNGLPGAFTFYSQLNANQKRAYDVIVAAKAGLDTASASASSVDIPIHYYLTQSEFDAFWSNSVMGNAIEGALAAVIEDYPEYFWIGGLGWGAGASYSSGKYDVTITLNLPLDTSAYANFGVVRNYYNGLIQAVDSFKAVGGNRYQMLKSIHDQIAKAVSYDTDFNNPIAHQPTSVFFAPFEPVCEGYAEALKLICDKYGIPCIGVVGLGNGGAHKWNYVQMEDGKWYGMDLTWDDQSSVMYDYFLVGSQTKNAFFGQATFGDQHSPTGEEFNGSSVTLTYPTLSTTSYSLAVPNLNSTLSFDAANNRVYFGKNATLRSEFFALCNYSNPAQISGQTVTVSGTTTGATVTVKNGGLTKVYNAVRRGDVDANNSVNTTDYSRMKNTVSGTGSGLTENTAGYWAGDFDDDGSLDAFDLYYMDMYLNGNIDY